MKGRVIKLISNKWTVECDKKYYECSSIGKFRYQKISPLVGDMVDFDLEKCLVWHKVNNYFIEVYADIRHWI